MDSQTEVDLESLLARFDRSSPETLLASIASELVRLHRSHQTLLARVAAMEALQATIDRIAGDTPEMLTMELPASVEIDATYSLSGAWGFYDLEYGETGRAYRWTGPDPQFSFNFFIDRKTPLKFALQFGRIYADVPPTAIRCYADGKEAEVELINTRDSFQLKGLLPPRLDRGASVLSFICPTMLSPSDDSTSTDKRLLGMAFERLKVDPLPGEGDAAFAATDAAVNRSATVVPPASAATLATAAVAAAPESVPGGASSVLKVRDITAAFMALSETDEAVPGDVEDVPPARRRRGAAQGREKPKAR